MLPNPIAKVLSAHQQAHADLSAEIAQVQLVSRHSVPAEKIVKLALLHDVLGKMQVLFPRHCLVDIDRLNAQLGRDLVALPTAEVEGLQQRFQLTDLPALPDITGFPAVADERLRLLDEVFLDAGLPDQLVRMSGHLFETLLGKVKFLKFAVPIRSIPVNYDNSEQDLEQINTAISKFTRLRIQQRLEDTLELPPLPETAQRILKLRVDPDAGVSELSDVVETDPSLSAQVVSWASSSFYAAPGRIRSVHDAIMRVLGFDLVMNLAMGLSLGRTLKLPKDAPEGITPYWRQSVWVATTASAITTAIPREHRPEFGLSYLSGLLHNFGYLVLAHVFPPHFSLICRYTECNRHLDTAFIEHYLLGITREQIGSKLMELWNMPQEIATALRQQKNPFYEGEHAAYSGILFIATQMLRAEGVIAGPALPIPSVLFERLHLDREAAQEALEELLESSDALTSIADSLGAG